jgi:hypothetical protein
VPDAAGDFDAVALDLHPPAAAVAQLAASQVAVQRLAIQLQTGGHALDDAGESGTVRLARCGQRQGHDDSLRVMTTACGS